MYTDHDHNHNDAVLLSIHPASPSNLSLSLSVSLSLYFSRSCVQASLPHYWATSGWCPPSIATPAGLEEFALEESSWQMHAIIASLPYKGIEILRIHNLLALIEAPVSTGPIDPTAFNYSRLDRVVDMIAGEFGFNIGFELMGNPPIVNTDGSLAGLVFSDWGNSTQLIAWKAMVSEIARRYIAKYGEDKVANWKFETWNEPDHGCNNKTKMHSNITCDMTSWLGYFDACANGLKEVSERLLFGGPGSGGDTLREPTFLAAMLEHVQKAGNATKLDYVQWHMKGYDTNTATDLQIANLAISSGVDPNMPIGNEEVDPLGGWNKVASWRGDAQYPAAAAKILNMHQLLIREPLAGKTNYAYHSNDNSFLNYGDQWYDQRTLVVRFEMNTTGTVEVLPKPILNFMAAMSLLGDVKYPLSVTPDPNTSSVGILATSRRDDISPISEVSFMMYNSGDLGEPCNGSSCTSHVDLTLNGLERFGSHGRITRYMIDNSHGNPRALWSEFGGANNPYPSATQFESLRNESSLSLLSQESVNISAGGFNVRAELPQPSVSVIHFCLLPEGTVAPDLPQVQNVSLHKTPTKSPPTTFIRWSSLTSRCLSGYEIEVSPEPGSDPTTIASSILFAYHVHVHKESVEASGCFKVRGLDVWNNKGPWSEEICHHNVQ